MERVVSASSQTHQSLSKAVTICAIVSPLVSGTYVHVSSPKAAVAAAKRRKVYGPSALLMHAPKLPSPRGCVSSSTVNT